MRAAMLRPLNWLSAIMSTRSRATSISPTRSRTSRSSSLRRRRLPSLAGDPLFHPSMCGSLARALLRRLPQRPRRRPCRLSLSRAITRHARSRRGITVARPAGEASRSRPSCKPVTMVLSATMVRSATWPVNLAPNPLPRAGRRGKGAGRTTASSAWRLSEADPAVNAVRCPFGPDLVPLRRLRDECIRCLHLVCGLLGCGPAHRPTDIEPGG